MPDRTGTSTDSFITATGAFNTSPFATPNGWPKPASSTSVGSKGDSYDNALAESFNGLYKTELIHRRGPWKNVDHVEWATLTYVDWFNNRRIHNEIGSGSMYPHAHHSASYSKPLDGNGSESS